jgi:DNA-binding XRE family transcriptional regulator
MEVIADHELYEIPCASAIQHRLLAILKPYRVYGWQDVISDGAIPVDEVSAFKRLNKKYGKIGSVIRGYRSRDEMTQVELAKRLNISLYTLAQIEMGRRVVDKKLACKLAKIFRTGYQVFI